MTVTAALSEYSATIRLDALPGEVVERVRFLLLDLVGNIVRAPSRTLPCSPPLCALVSREEFGRVRRCCTVYAGRGGVHHGVLAHSLD